MIGSAAMLFMLGADHQAGGHGGGTRRTGPAPPGWPASASAVALVLAAYFVLHTLRCADRLLAARPAAVRLRSGRQPAPGAAPGGAAAPLPPRPARRRGPCSTRPSALAHLLMTVAMAVMLVGMI